MNELYEEGRISDTLYALSRGPHHHVRVFNRSFINGFYFRTASIEGSLNTQNSGVAVKGTDSSASMEWYGVIKKILTLDFPGEKEVVLFQCDWYDVPAPSKNKGRGYRKDQYGIVDVDTTRFRYLNDPYILGTQAEQLFYVKGAKKSEWSSIVRLKPRNLFSMPEPLDIENEGELDIDSLEVGVEAMNILNQNEDLLAWRRTDLEGVTGDATVIENVQPMPEPCDADLIDDEDDDTDDTYIDDGHVAPVNSLGTGLDDEFFV